MSHDEDMLATVYADKRTLYLREDFSPDCLNGVIGNFIRDIVFSLREQHCKLIGHIKGGIENESGDFLYFNMTGFNGDPDVNGEVRAMHFGVEMAINIIVFGVPLSSVKEIHERLLLKYLI